MKVYDGSDSIQRAHHLQDHTSKRMDANKIYQGDTHELLNRIPDSSVDLVICDGPYGITNNEWDRISNIQEYNPRLIERFSRVLKDGAALYLFGKQDCIDFVDYRPFLTLKSRIVWYQPSRLAQGRINFTNNYDVICYFVKGPKASTYNLDDIRVPQLVELEHRLRCEKVPSVTNGLYGKTKFNDRGKNPGDVWGDIKQLTYKSKELVSRDVLNTIQKPLKLIERLVKASSQEGELVLDPFCGVGTALVACKALKRGFIGFEQNPDFVAAAKRRLRQVEKAQAEVLF